MVRRGEDWWTCCLMARALNRCPSMIVLDKYSLFVHATVGVLSDIIPIYVHVSMSLVPFVQEQAIGVGDQPFLDHY